LRKTFATKKGEKKCGLKMLVGEQASPQQKPELAIATAEKKGTKRGADGF
jgi:hypothetical protein